MRELSSVQLSMFTRKTGYTPFRLGFRRGYHCIIGPFYSFSVLFPITWSATLCVVLLSYVLCYWVMCCFVGLCVVLLSYVLFCWVQTQFSLGRHKQNRFRNDISENGALNYCYGVTCWLLSIRSLWSDTYTTEKHAYKYTTVSLLSDKHLNHFNYIINKIIRWSHSTWITLLLTGRLITWRIRVRDLVNNRWGCIVAVLCWACMSCKNRWRRWPIEITYI